MRAAKYFYGQELKQLVDNSTYNYTQIAKALGISTKTLTNWFDGIGSPSELQAAHIRYHCFKGEMKQHWREFLRHFGLSPTRIDKD